MPLDGPAIQRHNAEKGLEDEAGSGFDVASAAPAHLMPYKGRSRPRAWWPPPGGLSIGLPSQRLSDSEGSHDDATTL